METIRKCPFSGKVFKPRRSNQRFASGKNRIAYHNRKYREKRMPLERMNQKLFFNYSKLEIILGDNEEAYVSVRDLKNSGFDFTVFTQFIDNDDEIYFGLYDMVYKKVDDNKLYIKKNGAN
ncbi:hypothetical protein LB452_13030 [Psychroflexus sp. CAK8W]|uniref:Uncharacterized protein n=1 Tax=Psychroflexus longus TaxID=2873596 RepID=A0ABS7XM76_9FLAO|nr:hypothetical protein [Psychroflexus longus]MBZ9779845.1 hypothetical protein [Psychroflexus longus]